MSNAGEAKIAWSHFVDTVGKIVAENPGGIRDSEIGKQIGCHNSWRKSHYGWVVWTAMGHLMKDGKVRFDSETKLYFPVKP